MSHNVSFTTYDNVGEDECGGALMCLGERYLLGIAVIAFFNVANFLYRGVVGCCNDPHYHTIR
jgi:hypothetical protein